MNKSIMMRFFSLGLAIAGFILIGASSSQAQTQDPFSKPAWAKPRTAPTSGSPTTNSQSKPVKPKPAGPPPIVVVAAPGIEQRIAFYKQQREAAALNGLELPKVTSVLTLDEMAVIGIFRTPRGYAAMVQAKPINLSYTVYPGEKFFDGQLVAVEENRLVFKKVIKMSNNKFVAAVENKTLQQYSVEQEVNGTAPVQTGGKVEEASNTPPVNSSTAVPPIVPGEPKISVVAPKIVLSPLDEMNRQPKEQPNDAKAKTDKKGGKRTDKKTDSKADNKSIDKTDKKANKKTDKKQVKVAENKKP